MNVTTAMRRLGEVAHIQPQFLCIRSSRHDGSADDPASDFAWHIAGFDGGREPRDKPITTSRQWRAVIASAVVPLSLEGKANCAVVGCCLLDDAEHDGADEGHGEVRGDYAQSPGERHEVASSMHAALRTDIVVNRESRCEKVSLAVAQPWQRFVAGEPAWLKNGEIDTLKSL